MMRLRIPQLVIVAAVVAALLAGLDGLDPTPAKARKGYGGGGYKHCGKGCYTKKCRKSCGRAKRTCVYCVKQDTKPLKAACKGQGPACRAGVKAQIKAALQTCKGATGGCKGCCKQDYAGACVSSFEGTSGFGTYFRKGNYGKKRYKPECDGNYVGGPGPTCVRACERARAIALRTCGGKRGRGCDTAAIEAEYQACLAGCGVTTTSTTPSSSSTSVSPTTSTTLPACHDPALQTISGRWSGSFSGGHTGTWEGVVTQTGNAISWTTTVRYDDLMVCSNSPATFCATAAQCGGGSCDDWVVSGTAEGTNNCGLLYWEAPGIATYTANLVAVVDCLVGTWQGSDGTSGAVSGCRVAASVSGAFVDDRQP
jgi:hypothetical protein